MSFDLSQFHQTFFDETREHLDEMERLLLAIDVVAPEAEDLDAIFRAAHSIKGGSATFGFTDIAHVTHALESLLDLVRKHQLTLTTDIIEASLQAGDILRIQLRSHRDGTDFDPQEALPVVAKLESLMTISPAQALSELSATSLQVSPTAAQMGFFNICYRPLDQSAATFESLQEELAKLGELEIASKTETELTCTLKASIPACEIEDLFSYVASPSEYTIQLVDETEAPPANMAKQELLEALAGETSATETQSFIEEDGFGFFIEPSSLRPPAEDPGYGFFVDLAPMPSAPTEPQASIPTAASVDLTEHPRRRASDREAETSIRVSVDKVDQLINLVGELVITNAMLAQTASNLDPVQYQNLFNGMAQLDRNSRDLQEAVMSIRMLPIGSVFSRFPRLVRDLAGKLGKQVELKLIGESTELDKGLIERLSDPLTHLIRNSLDHGIETPEIRMRNGKPAKGILTLQAYHQGGNIIVEVLDDGAGLKRERILAKAHERGLAVDDNAPDQEIWQLLFAPGFSTAEQITDVSGRGVGMDVVKRNIEGMGGRVEINTQPGSGTRITIRLPLTLAILDGMSIGVGEQTFILPLNMIVESLQPTPAQISSISGSGRVVHVLNIYR